MISSWKSRKMNSYVTGLIQRMGGDVTIPHLEWNHKLSVGVALMDDEHKELAGLLNVLYDAVQKRQGPEAIGKALDDLIDHTASHFRHEEELFAQTGYPEAEEHGRAHEILMIQVLHLRKKYREGVTASLSPDLLKFLRSWLVSHILLSDRKFGKYLSAEGIRFGPLPEAAAEFSQRHAGQ